MLTDDYDNPYDGVIDYDYLMLMQDESIAYMNGLDDEQELEFEAA